MRKWILCDIFNFDFIGSTLETFKFNFPVDLIKQNNTQYDLVFMYVPNLYIL